MMYNNDICILPLKTEVSTNIQTGEQRHLTHVCSSGYPRLFIKSKRKDSIIGYLTLSAADVERIYKCDKLADENNLQAVEMNSVLLPGMQVVYPETEYVWLVERFGGETHEISKLTDAHIRIEENMIFLHVGGYIRHHCQHDTIPEEEIYTEFSWNITDAMQDWYDEHEPIQSYTTNEFVEKESHE